MKNRAFLARLGFALSGIALAWRRERSFRTQVGLGAAALCVTIAVRPGLVWVALVVLAIALVLALEMINSAIEAIADHLHPELATAIKIGKDIAAGAVLLASMASVLIAALMLAARFGE